MNRSLLVVKEYVKKMEANYKRRAEQKGHLNERVSWRIGTLAWKNDIRQNTPVSDAIRVRVLASVVSARDR